MRWMNDIPIAIGRALWSHCVRLQNDHRRLRISCSRPGGSEARGVSARRGSDRGSPGSTAAATSSRSRTHSKGRHSMSGSGSRTTCPTGALARRPRAVRGRRRASATRIDADQEPWNRDVDRELRVSSLQTGVFAGPVGSDIGQHRFRRGLVVREAQENAALYTPRYGLFELQARALDDPATMVALWMIGYEDEPDRSAEICVCEIFGRDVGRVHGPRWDGAAPVRRSVDHGRVPAESMPIDVRQTHTYSVVWALDLVAFYVDDRRIKVVHESPSYPMQFMLSIYDFRERSGRNCRPGALSEGLRGGSFPRLSTSRSARPGATAGGGLRPDDAPKHNRAGARLDDGVAVR